MEVKKTSKFDAALIPVNVNQAKFTPYFPANSRLLKPSGDDPQNMNVSKVCVVEPGGVYQDNIPTIIGTGTPNGLHLSCLGFQVIAYLNHRLPSHMVHKL